MESCSFEPDTGPSRSLVVTESQDNLVRTSCPRCHARLKTPASHAGHRLPCPMCGQEIEVGGHALPPPLRDSQVVVAPPADADEYAIQETTYDVQEPPPVERYEATAPVEDEYGQAAAQTPSGAASRGERTHGLGVILPSERPKLPRWPMINGVLSFFFQTGAIVCWSGFSVLAVVVLVIFNIAAQAAGVGLFGPVAAFLMGLIGLAVSVIGLISITGFLMAILQDSAAGNKVVVQWPGAVFIDWVGGAIYFLVSLVIPLGLMYVLALPFGGILAQAWIVPIGWWLLFPVVMLSTLEMQSPLTPVSPIVLQSFVKCGGAWALFYLETGGMGLIVGSVTGVILLLAPNLAGFTILAGVLVAAAMLYFRLLGRLAWICDEYFRNEVEEDEEDEEDAEPEEEDPPIRPTPINDF